LAAVWLLLTAASAGVFLHAGIKFPWFVFFQKDSGLRPADPPASMRLAMLLFAFLCLAIGIWPEPLYRMLPYPVEYQAYTAAHIVTGLQLLLFSGLAFFLMLGFLKRTLTITLDADWTWRVLLPALARRTETLIAAGRSLVESALAETMRRLMLFIGQRATQDLLLRTWPTRDMALWVMAMLLAYMMFYYLG
jgi:multicomponent Na+:H+ antiporter subunit D